ncbi:LamG-like jellyroll fold domain-containing protein [Flavobacterium sp.]|jgi:hypothetical protein|uniref:LamG-like jellyroll fold domain-containing protein n=1 Tax=Flavobacterium sp. TaxID=239 RepID=UPI002B86328B|nr:LamG-like jellyroll fold domain-containing protein [Flavobacterium sp.]MCA0349928.1 T9SS type A sorting domain-containing protein [Bacteroidota bacterium]HQA74146.1 T9SS type A sorting domain-containing protein [Flavobacterium sp.]
MKTKLLLLLLLAFSFANAQLMVPSVGVNTITNITQTTATVNYAIRTNGTYTNARIEHSLVSNMSTLIAQSSFIGFSNNGAWQYASYNLSGLVPNTTYYVRAVASNSLGTTTSNILSFTTVGNIIPDITAVGVGVTENSATINYSLNANLSATTSIVKYGTSSDALNSQVSGFSATGNTTSAGSALITGLQQNTQYFYQIEAINSFGTALSSGSFQTALPPQILANYTFDNTLSDVNGANAFELQAGMTYGTDRSGVANKALFINGTGTTVSLTNLPVGNSSRTFSFWIKPTQSNGSNRIFSYGSPSGTAAYGASFDATRVYNFSWTTNLSFLQSTSLNVWKHIVCTYEQSTSTASLYTDGVLRASVTANWSTANNGIFYLGSLFGETGSRYIGFLDDLQIYNYALTGAEITSLYTSNTLSSLNFSQNNLEVALYPNPTKEVLNIQMTNEVKTVEIFNLQGQKVVTSNQKQIIVSNLSRGLYMVKIEDMKGNTASKKVVFE